MAPNVLLICGSLNQTTMMHKISRQMPDYNCIFSPFYADGLMGVASKAGLADFCILGGRHRRATEAYLKKEGLPIDIGGRRYNYDAVITGTDLIVQENVRQKRLILVQEGMTEEEDFLYFLVRRFKLPRFLANTAATGLSNAFDIFCVASAGYRNLFIQKGVKPDKIVVTGIPNFDHAVQYLQNDFPLHGYVLVATSSIRETMKFDDRKRFLQHAKQVAGERSVIFKLHPNENIKRAEAEIRKIFPHAPIYSDGNVHQMIANCDLLIAQNSSVVYIALALGKEVHSYLDRNLLKQLLPVQNGGKSAEKIAELCRRLVQIPVYDLKFKQAARRLTLKWEL